EADARNPYGPAGGIDHRSWRGTRRHLILPSDKFLPDDDLFDLLDRCFALSQVSHLKQKW
ncbi:MAG: hypothetical protein ABSG85_15440, partial [Spirochaetia bacterium]